MRYLCVVSAGLLFNWTRDEVGSGKREWGELMSLHFPALRPNICERIQHMRQFISWQVLRAMFAAIDGPIDEIYYGAVIVSSHFVEAGRGCEGRG